MKEPLPSQLFEKWKGVPDRPGVYVMKDAKGKIIYIGKALNLKKRTASYFNRSEQSDPKTSAMVGRIFQFDTIVTDSEKEALILESNLIKRYRPKYNVILKDGKRYPSICINIENPFPFLSIVRKIENNGSAYFGPYSSSAAVSQTIKMINKTFKLRKCRTQNPKRKRPCLYYQMNECPAPCCFDVPHEAYHKVIEEVMLFLNGRTPNLMNQLKAEMKQLADQKKYEQAAVIRDKFFSLQKTLEKQIIVSNDFQDRDVIALAEEEDLSIITLIIVRGGFLLGTSHYEISETMATREEKIETFLKQYYEDDRFIPKEILISEPIESKNSMETLLKERKGLKVTISEPKKGQKAKLVKMAFVNSEKELKERIRARTSRTDILTRLQKKLGMETCPSRIECFDNSNISGESPVAGMVVFQNGFPEKSSYRKYKIRSVEGPDDYASMYEVLQRRFRDQSSNRQPNPDLLIVDGGKGQLGIAVSVLRQLKLEKTFSIIGIAKKNQLTGEAQDKIYQPGRGNPVNLSQDGDLLLFLQQIRDEAHRFAISFHRKQRVKNLVKSAIDDIPGIGPKRKKMLLKHFKSIKRLRAADISEIIELPGMDENIAKHLLQHLQKT
ncbi:MAG: excinuclease ABC subunit UvrC [Pseudomonadota bacterium]